MKIDSIKIKIDGYVYCQSAFYTVHDLFKDDFEYVFFNKINILTGEIDSGSWAVSYLLSMYKYHKRDFILYDKPNVVVNDNEMSLDELLRYSCYMDESYPLFSSKKTVKHLVTKGLKLNNRQETAEDIRDLFAMENFRFERPLTCVGNEIFQAMAAIGYCYGKEVFCFPWMSKKRFDAFHKRIPYVLEVLESLNKVVIVPIGE